MKIASKNKAKNFYVTLYSGVPNKHAARLLISEKISLPTCSIWSYTFIRILKIVLPTFTKLSKVPSICCSILNNAPVCPKINTILAFGSPSTYPYSAINLSYMFILPYTIKFPKKNLSYTFIWPYRFIRFLTFSLPTLLFGLHVYLAHQSITN